MNAKSPRTEETVEKPWPPLRPWTRKSPKSAGRMGEDLLSGLSGVVPWANQTWRAGKSTN